VAAAVAAVVVVAVERVAAVVGAKALRRRTMTPGCHPSPRLEFRALPS